MDSALHFQNRRLIEKNKGLIPYEMYVSSCATDLLLPRKLYIKSSLAINNTIILLYYTEVFPDIYESIESKLYTSKGVC